MMSGLSRLQLYNMVADHIEDAEISSVTGSGKLVRAIRRWEPIVRDQLLREHPWNFAKKRATLTATDEPLFDWDYQYELPANCLRILDLTTDGIFEGALIPYEVEQGPNGKPVILCDEVAPVYVKYIVREENTGRWDPLFCAAWAARVARLIAAKITSKKSMVELLAAIEKDALQKAQVIDAQEGTAERPVRDEWENERSGAW